MIKAKHSSCVVAVHSAGGQTSPCITPPSAGRVPQRCLKKKQLSTNCSRITTVTKAMFCFSMCASVFSMCYEAMICACACSECTASSWARTIMSAMVETNSQDSVPTRLNEEPRNRFNDLEILNCEYF